MNRPFSYEQNRSESSSWIFPSPLNTSFDFKNNSSLSFLPYNITPKQEFLAPRIKKFKLKFILNLKRTDNPNAQNVLYVVTYPIDLVPAPLNYNMTGSNYINDAIDYANQSGPNPTVPTNKVIPASQSELATICSNSTYKANRISSASRNQVSDLMTSLEKTNYQRVEPIIFPVPVQDKLNIITNNCKIIAIINSFGQVVKEFTTNASNDNEITVDTSNLSKGIYIMSYLDLNNNLKSIKFIVE